MAEEGDHGRHRSEAAMADSRNGNPTLRNAERDAGRSGHAIRAKGTSATTGRDDSIDRGARRQQRQRSRGSGQHQES